MKLPFNQLESHLERGLAGLYLIAADEPLLVAEATDRIRQSALAQGYDERKVFFVERSFRWDALERDGESLSLFSSRRIVEIRMATPRPGTDGAAAIRALAEAADPDRLVLIAIQARLDKAALNSVWVKAIEKHGVNVEIRALRHSDLPRFIVARGRQKGLTVEADAAALLADRTEGNLLAADQELTKLALISDGARIDARRVLDAVGSNARYDVFRLSDALLAGDLERALIVFDGLRSEGLAPALVLWALSRDLALLSRLKHAESEGGNPGEIMASLRIWQTRQSVIRRAMARYSDAELARLLRFASRVDRTVKGLVQAPAWEAVLELLFESLAPAAYRRLA